MEGKQGVLQGPSRSTARWSRRAWCPEYNDPGGATESKPVVLQGPSRSVVPWSRVQSLSIPGPVAASGRKPVELQGPSLPDVPWPTPSPPCPSCLLIPARGFSTAVPGQSAPTLRGKVAPTLRGKVGEPGAAIAPSRGARGFEPVDADSPAMEAIGEDWRGLTSGTSEGHSPGEGEVLEVPARHPRNPKGRPPTPSPGPHCPKRFPSRFIRRWGPGTNAGGATGGVFRTLDRGLTGLNLAYLV